MICESGVVPIQDRLLLRGRDLEEFFYSLERIPSGKYRITTTIIL